MQGVKHEKTMPFTIHVLLLFLLMGLTSFIWQLASARPEVASYGYNKSSRSGRGHYEILLNNILPRIIQDEITGVQFNPTANDNQRPIYRVGETSLSTTDLPLQINKWPTVKNEMTESGGYTPALSGENQKRPLDLSTIDFDESTRDGNALATETVTETKDVTVEMPSRETEESTGGPPITLIDTNCTPYMSELVTTVAAPEATVINYGESVTETERPLFVDEVSQSDINVDYTHNKTDIENQFNDISFTESFVPQNVINVTKKTTPFQNDITKLSVGCRTDINCDKKNITETVDFHFGKTPSESIVPVRMDDKIASVISWKNSLINKKDNKSTQNSVSMNDLSSSDSYTGPPIEQIIVNSNKSSQVEIADNIQNGAVIEATDITTNIPFGNAESNTIIILTKPAVAGILSNSSIHTVQNITNSADKPLVSDHTIPKLPTPLVNNKPIIQIVSNCGKDPCINEVKDEVTNAETESVTEIRGEYDYDMVVETLTSTVTVNLIAESIRQQHPTAHRIQRSIHSNIVPSESIESDLMTTYVDIDGRSTNKLKKGGRRSDPEPDIDDIIQGIMQLLGGNVKIDAESVRNTMLTTFGGGHPVTSTRTNDRGPPRMPLNPFNFFQGHPSRTRPPIRQPVTAMSGEKPPRGRPSFVANTLPPFFATLPPELDRPRPQVNTQRPTLTAFPINVDLVPESQETEIVSPTPALPHMNSLKETSISNVETTTNISEGTQSISQESASHEEITPHTVSTIPTSTTTTTTTTATTDASEEIDVSSQAADINTSTSPPQEDHLKEDNNTREQANKILVELESSIKPSDSSLTTSSVKPTDTSDTKSSIKPSNTTSTKYLSSKKPTDTADTKSSKNSSDTIVTRPTDEVVSNILFSTTDVSTLLTRSQSLATEVSTNTHKPVFTSTSATSTSHFQYAPTNSPTLDLPATSTIALHETRTRLPDHHHTRIPPLRPLYPYNEGSAMNTMRPTPPLQLPRPGFVLDANYLPGQVVTDPVVAHTDFSGQVFDVTVTAHQGFGGPVQPPYKRPSYQQPPGDIPESDFLEEEPLGSDVKVLVTPVAGTDGYVSIDGRKTYFDLFGGSPTKPPPQHTLGMGVGVIIPEEEVIDGTYDSDDYAIGPPGPPYDIPSQPFHNVPSQQPPYKTAPSHQPQYNNIPSQRPSHNSMHSQQPHYNRTPSQRPSNEDISSQQPSLAPSAYPPYGQYPPISTYRPSTHRPPLPSQTAAPFKRRTTPASIRIDTCIVGDDSTCQEQLQEVCRTEGDVSSCYCKPGTERRRPRTPCKKMVLLEMSIKVDRVGNQRISWNGNYANPESEEYQILDWEAKKAIDSAFTKSALNSVYLGNSIQKFYSLGGNVIVNSTIRLEDNVNTRSRNIRRNLQRHIIKVIQAHNNNIGQSSIWVDGPLNPIPAVDDVNECSVVTLNNCHKEAVCINEFATFTCRCLPGYTDRYSKDPDRVGRTCESCTTDYCHKRGECSIEDGQKVCRCKGSYYGVRCEVDGEVVAVAVGASVAAVVIIVLTLLFLCLWSRRWKTQDQKSEALRRGGLWARAAAGGQYLQQKFAMSGQQPQPQQYGATMEDHIRWAHMNETAMAVQQNLYGNGADPRGGFFLGNSSSQEFLAGGGVPIRTRPHRHYQESVYSRVSRTLSNPATASSRVMAGIRKIFRQSSTSGNKKTGGGDLSAFIVSPNPNTMNLQQMMALQAHLAASTSHDHGTGTNSHNPPPSSAQSLYKSHGRQVGGASSVDYGSMCSPTPYGGSQYGLQHLNPAMLPLPVLTHQGFPRATSSYGQYPGPASLTMSQSGISRAATLQLCDPAHSGASGLETSSEEEESRRGHGGGGYHLPRPKSHASVGDSSDLYYELDEMTSSPPPPITSDFSHFHSFNTLGQRDSNFQGNDLRAHRKSLRYNPPYPAKPPPPLPRHIFNN